MFLRPGNLFLLIAGLLAFSIQTHAQEIPIRICEGCHGFESLHNIQLDSDPGATCDAGFCSDDSSLCTEDADCNSIDPGAEDAYYGHIGHNDDCWGCHGFASTSAAPGTGPVVPYISSSDISVVTAGTETVVTLSGSAFINFVIPPIGDPIELVSVVELTAADGSVISLTPDSVTESQIVVILPGSLSAGNYGLRAVKGPSESNPTVISIKPDVTITDVSCNRKKGVLTISGYGFSKKPEGTDEYINIEVDGQTVEITSWSDTQIKVPVSSCPKRAIITVNALFGSATNDGSSGGGKPDKPCKGKKC
ncbi:MAG: hypothetical protein KAQ85_02065 [Thermodesulfovibrionia bacterium]|nr:hypothetical protein [Thermodesulfovibrionia bacterium]